MLCRWSKQFITTGSVKKQSRPGRPLASKQTVESVRLSFVRSLKKSLSRRSLDIGIFVSTFHNVLHKRTHLYAYKIQLCSSKNQINRFDYKSRIGYVYTEPDGKNE